MQEELDRVFAPDGLLAGAVRDYSPRPEQQHMAHAVAEAMASLSDLVVEAGTGTGKTFAYLVPALLSGRRVAISTGTRALQDQLFHRDLPTLAAAIGVPVRVAMLKGRSNYLCRYRLDQAQPQDAEDAIFLQRIRAFSFATGDGDVGEITDVPEGAAVWSRVTSTADNCLGSRCPAYEECFVVAARRTAAAADLVVVNHHLLLADLALREIGFGELLPAVDVVVVDEAHQVPDIAAQQFGRSLSQAQLVGWLRDLDVEVLAAGLGDDLARESAGIAEATQQLRQLLGAEGRRLSWAEVPAAGGELLARLAELLDDAAGILDAWAETRAGLDSVRRRAADFAAFASEFQTPPDGGELRWVDVHRFSFTLHCTPIETSQPLGEALASRSCAWIFTSATLAVEDDFDHFLERVGLPGDARTLRLTSPFDYQKNALLYLPDGMPAPAHPSYVECVGRLALPLLQANPGGAFMLFTSHRALAAAHRWLDGRTDRLLLAQGQAPRTTLLERFRSDGRAVLLGTASFWEGVDVRGPALALVIIDKLPFASPAEPLLRARLDWLAQQGRSGFTEHQLPAAVIALKQGVGRLIRDPMDTGVLMICDPRLRQRGYGRRFLRSLPAMGCTSDAAVAMEFLARPGRTSQAGDDAAGPAADAGGLAEGGGALS